MQTVEKRQKQIEQEAKEYAKFFDNGKIFKSVIYALQQGFQAGATLYAAKPDLHKTYNEKYCIGYPISSLELQKEKIKQIFGHSDAYTIEQYVNGLIELVQSNASQSRWVKVSDVEPEIDVPYNIVYSGVVQWVAYKFDGENWVDMHDIAPALPKNHVSHYQPLPTPPKE